MSWADLYDDDATVSNDSAPLPKLNDADGTTESESPNAEAACSCQAGLAGCTRDDCDQCKGLIARLDKMEDTLNSLAACSATWAALDQCTAALSSQSTWSRSCVIA